MAKTAEVGFLSEQEWKKMIVGADGPCISILEPIPTLTNRPRRPVRLKRAIESVEQILSDRLVDPSRQTQLLEPLYEFEANEQGRELGVYTVGVVTCRPTKKQAQEYYHHSIVEHADWSAVDGILALKNISPQTVPMPEYVLKRNQYAQGMGGLPIVGDPDFVAQQLADLSQAGLTGIGVSLVNYADELPFFCDEVLPRLARMGVRECRDSQSREAQ